MYIVRIWQYNTCFKRGEEDGKGEEGEDTETIQLKKKKKSLYVCVMSQRHGQTTEWILIKLCRHDPLVPGQVYHSKRM